MKIKAAYYLRNMPTKIAVVLPDNRAMITNLAPKIVTENDLSTLAMLEQPAYRRAALVDEMPEYNFIVYGFEKVKE